jgi:hypothetical protein
MSDAYRIESQSSLEYFSTYGWALLLIAIVGVVIFAYSSTYYNIVPSTCSMQSGAACSDVVIGANSITGNVVASILFINKEQYPLAKPEVFFNINGTNTTATYCQPGFVLPGGAIVCITSISSNKFTNRFVAGGIYLNATNCGTISNPYNAVECGAEGTRSTFAGSLVGHITPMTSSPFKVIIVSANSTQRDTGAKDPLYTKVLFYNQPLVGGTVQLRAYYQSNGANATPPYAIAPTVMATNDSGIALSYIWGYVPGEVIVNATFGNASATVPIDFVGLPTTSTTVPVMDTVELSITQTGAASQWSSCFAYTPQGGTQQPLECVGSTNSNSSLVDVAVPSGSTITYLCTRQTAQSNYEWDTWQDAVNLPAQCPGSGDYLTVSNSVAVILAGVVPASSTTSTIPYSEYYQVLMNDTPSNASSQYYACWQVNGFSKLCDTSANGQEGDTYPLGSVLDYLNVSHVAGTGTTGNYFAFGNWTIGANAPIRTGTWTGNIILDSNITINAHFYQNRTASCKSSPFVSQSNNEYMGSSNPACGESTVSTQCGTYLEWGCTGVTPICNDTYLESNTAIPNSGNACLSGKYNVTEGCAVYYGGGGTICTSN